MMCDCEQYVIGTLDAPDWCIRRLMPYKKADGSTGYLFYGKRRSFELTKGDMLVNCGNRIDVKRGGELKWSQNTEIVRSQETAKPMIL